MTSVEISQLLQAWSDGDQEALGSLTSLVYQDLHRLAHHYMVREDTGHSLQTTALIDELYLRLVGLRRVNWQNRAHFFAVCAQLMRRVLVDFARSQRSLKRGGGAPHLSLDEAPVLSRVTYSQESQPGFVQRNCSSRVLNASTTDLNSDFENSAHSV